MNRKPSNPRKPAAVRRGGAAAPRRDAARAREGGRPRGGPSSPSSSCCCSASAPGASSTGRGSWRRRAPRAAAPTPRNALALAERYAGQGEYGRALDIIDQVLLKDAGNKDAIAAQARILEQKRAAESRAEEQARQEREAQAKRGEQDLARIVDRIQRTEPREGKAQGPAAPPPVVEVVKADPAKERNAAEAERVRKINELLDRAARQMAAKDYPGARRTYKDVLALDPDSAQAYAYTGEAWYLEDPKNPQDVEQAVYNANKAIEKDPALWVPHKTLGQIYLDQRNWDAAITELKEAARLKPNDYLLLYNLGVAQYNASRYGDAQQSFEASIHAKDDFYPAHFRLGRTLMVLNQPSRALASLRRAAALERNDDVVQYYIGEVLRQQGDLAGAVAAYDQASRINPQEPGYYRKAGTTLLTLGRAAEAESRLRTALAQDAQSSITQFNMSQALVAQGKYEDALAYASRAVELEPGSALYNFQAGVVQERRGRTDEAIRLYSQAVTLDPTYPEPLINLGGLYDGKGLYDNSLQLLTRAYQLAPNNYLVNNNLGNVYMHKGLHEQSISYFLKAISLKGDARDPRYNLGLSYLETGRDADASRAFSELIKIDATYWDAYFQLSKLLVKQGDKATAKNLLETLLRKKPDYGQRAEAEALLAKL